MIAHIMDMLCSCSTESPADSPFQALENKRSRGGAPAARSARGPAGNASHTPVAIAGSYGKWAGKRAQAAGLLGKSVAQWEMSWEELC